MKERRLELRLSAEDDGRTRALADQAGITVSTLIRELLRAAYVRAGNAVVRTAPSTGVRTEVADTIVRTVAGPAGGERVLSYAEKLALRMVSIHRQLLRSEPSEAQRAFYTQAWTQRSMAVLPCQESAAATMVAALGLATMGSLPVQVPILVRRAHLSVIEDFLKGHARTASNLDGDLASKLVEAFPRVHLVCEAEWPMLSQPVWVAFGVTAEDSVPDWARSGLPSVEQVRKDSSLKQDCPPVVDDIAKISGGLGDAR